VPAAPLPLAGHHYVEIEGVEQSQGFGARVVVDACARLVEGDRPRVDVGDVESPVSHVIRSAMADHRVSVRDLRNHGGDVLDRVAAGEVVTVTRAGKPVAELRPLSRPALTSEALLQRWRRLPALDGARLRADIDAVIDPSL
jgi:prevent-host-death family protein